MAQTARKSISDRQIRWIVFLLFAVSVLIRYLLSCYSRSYVIFMDECLYWNQARSLAAGRELSVRGAERSTDIILYQWLLSIIMRIAHSAAVRMQMVVLLNAVLTGSTVLWVYQIGKALKLKNEFILLAVVMVLSMPDYAMTVSVMTENLYFPVVTALFYVELRLIQAKTKKAILRYGIFLGIAFAAARLTRDIALCLILSYVFCEMFSCLVHLRKAGINKKGVGKAAGNSWSKDTAEETGNGRTGKIEREEIGEKRGREVAGEIFLEHAIRIGIPLACCAVCYGLCYAWIPNPDISGTGSSIISRVLGWLDPHSMALLVRSFLHNLTYSLAAFFFFPVLLPLLFGNELDKEEKKWSWNILLGFFAVLGISTLLLERSGTSNYQKLRYVFYFLVPLLMLFLLLFQRRELLHLEKRRWRICLGCMLVLVGLIVRYLKLTDYGSQADHSLLEYLRVIGQAIGDKSYQFGKLTIYAADLGLKILWIGMLALGIWLLRRNKKRFFLLSCLIMIGINLFNYLKCMELFREVKEVPDQRLHELEKLNDYVNGLDGDVLVLIHDFNLAREASARIDTYMERELYFAGEKTLINLAEEKGYVDLTADFQSIINSLRSYRRPFKADYIILADPFAVLENVREIETDLKGFWIYQNLDPEKVYLHDYSLFPEENGKTHIFLAEDYVFESAYIDEEGDYRSAQEKDYLFFGPYLPIKAGVYRIKVNYRYTGEQTEGMIGNLDVNLQVNAPNRFLKSEHLFENTAIFAQNGSSELEVTASTDIYQAEIRLYTITEGVIFDSVEVTRLADTEEEWRQMPDSKKEEERKTVFPETVGETCVVTAEDALFLSDYFCHGTYRSEETEDYLFYGPYVSAKKGLYHIKVNYEYIGELQEGKIGNLDLHMKGDYQYSHVEIDAGERSGEMEIRLDQDVTEAEIRLFTYGAGVIFQSIEVTRVGDLSMFERDR